jgi:hypothetical protein
MPYYMYVSLQDDDKIRVLTMDAATGTLTQKGEVPVAGGPSPLTIREDGAVGGPPIAWLETATGAHAMQTDPSNQFAFVPHIAGNGPNAIFQFRFDDTTGHLTPNSPLGG